MNNSPLFRLTDDVVERPYLNIVDVGPAPPGTRQRWQNLLDAGTVRVTGFEASAATCAALSAAGSPHHLFRPSAIGDGSERTLHLTAHPAYASLYEPNHSYIRLLRGASPLFHVTGSQRVVTCRLDDTDVGRSAPCDYMHFDIPGAAFDALSHATSLLDTTMAIEIRVYLVPMYRDQPMLGDADALLRRRGFVVHRYLQSGGATLEHPPIDGGPGIYLNQDLWADFLYVKDFTTAASQPPERWVKLGTVLHEMYGSHDLAHLAFAHADERGGTDMARRYLAAYRATTASP